MVICFLLLSRSFCPCLVHFFPPVCRVSFVSVLFSIDWALKDPVSYCVRACTWHSIHVHNNKHFVLYSCWSIKSLKDHTYVENSKFNAKYVFFDLRDLLINTKHFIFITIYSLVPGIISHDFR